MAAVRGLAGAQFALGRMSHSAGGGPGDNLEAVRWYREAAERGHSGAGYWLGRWRGVGLTIPSSTPTPRNTIIGGPPKGDTSWPDTDQGCWPWTRGSTLGKMTAPAATCSIELSGSCWLASRSLPDAIEAVYPEAAVHTCIVHLIRRSPAYASYQERRLSPSAPVCLSSHRFLRRRLLDDGPGFPAHAGFPGGSGPPASSKRECRKASGVRGRPLPGAGAACPGPHRRTDLAGVSAPARKLSPAFGRGLMEGLALPGRTAPARTRLRGAPIPRLHWLPERRGDDS